MIYLSRWWSMLVTFSTIRDLPPNHIPSPQICSACVVLDSEPTVLGTYPSPDPRRVKDICHHQHLASPDRDVSHDSSQPTYGCLAIQCTPMMYASLSQSHAMFSSDNTGQNLELYGATRINAWPSSSTCTWFPFLLR